MGRRSYRSKKNMYSIAKKTWFALKETKRHTSSSSNTSVGDPVGNANTSAESRLYALDEMQAGGSQGQRIGNEIRASRLVLRGSLVGDASAGSITVVRLMVVQSKSGAQVEDSFPSTIVGQADQDEYRVLYDKVHTLNPVTDVIKTINLNMALYKKKWLGSKTGYKDSTLNAPTSNGLYLYAISNVARASTAPNILFSAQLYYKD